MADWMLGSPHARFFCAFKKKKCITKTVIVCLAFSPQPVLGIPPNVDSLILNICIIVGENVIARCQMNKKVK